MKAIIATLLVSTTSGANIRSRNKELAGPALFDPAVLKQWNSVCSKDGSLTTGEPIKNPKGLEAFLTPKMTCKSEAKEKPTGCADGGKGCFFTPAFKGGEHMLNWKQYCVQLDFPTGTPGLEVAVGLNTEYTQGASCDKVDPKKGGPCYMALHGDVNIGLKWDIGIGAATVYLTGTLDIETEEGKPCGPFIVKKDDDSWGKKDGESCGHARLFKAWLANFLGTSGIFENKAFTGAMYSSTVKNTGELKAEAKRMDDAEEIMNIVANLKGMDKKSKAKEAIAFQPKNHPLYRAGKMWNIAFHEYWFREVIKGENDWFKKNVAAHRHLQNRHEYKEAVAAAAAAAAVEPQPGQKAKAVVIPKKQYINPGDDPAGFGIKVGAAKLKIGADPNTLPWAIDFSKSITSKKLKTSKDVARLFIWYSRYILETSVLQYFYSDPTASRDKMDILSLESYEGFLSGKGTQYDPSLKTCSSLPTLFKGRIEGARLKDFVENADKYTNKLLPDAHLNFEGRPQMLCLFGKDIGMIEKKEFWDKRPRFHRKSCKHDMKAKSCTGKSSYSCSVCDKDNDKKTMHVNICDEAAAAKGKEKYSRILSTKPCSEKGPSTEGLKLIDGDDMHYMIPIFSAMAFPAVAKKVSMTLTEINACKDPESAIIKFLAFRKWLAMPVQHETIKQHWTNAFGVAQIDVTRKKCAEYPKKVCLAQELETVLIGQVFHHQSAYVEKLTSQLAEAQQKFNLLNSNKVFQEKYEWTTSVKISATISNILGSGGVGYCTPDTNLVAFSVPIWSWSGSINKGSGMVSKTFGGTVTVHPPIVGDYVAITLSTDRGLSDLAPRTTSVGFKIYLPRNSLQVGDDKVAFGTSYGPKAIAIAAQIVPIVAKLVDFGTTVAAQTESKDGADDKSSFKKRLTTYFKDLAKNIQTTGAAAFFGGLGLAAKVDFWKSAKESLMSESLMKRMSGSSYTEYVMVDVTATFTKETSEGFTTNKPEINAVASFFNVADGAFGFPGLKLRPAYGSGVQLDLGLLMNRAYQFVAKPTAKELARSKVKFAPVVAKGSSWSDSRSAVCSECTRQVQQFQTTQVDCAAKATLESIVAANEKEEVPMTEDEAQNLCNAVFYDITSFLASDETSFLFSKQQQQSEAKKQFKKEWDKFTLLEKEFNDVTGVVCKLFNSPMCMEQKFCEYGGVSCFGYQNRIIEFTNTEHGKKYVMSQVGQATVKGIEKLMAEKMAGKKKKKK